MKDRRPLPDWAQGLVPVGMDDAAILLGVSRRFLVDTLKRHPHYERRGTKKVFYPEHIALLREALTNHSSDPTAATASTAPLQRSAASAYEKALLLSTRKSLNRSGRS
jgi:hypothetical protein